jgi:hypothetical protein
MLTQDLLDKYNSLKKKKDAAYLVFKKEPSMINATRHSVATQAFTSFCIETMESLAEAPEVDLKEEILANIDEYKTCKQCDKVILYAVQENNSFVESSEFVPGFPGWCHTCLIDYCCNHECEYCARTDDYENCSYREIKNIYKATEE